MLAEALGSVLLGLAVACAALRWRPVRFRNHRLVLATGPVAAVGGGLITRAVLGPGHLPVALIMAVGVAAALISLLHDAPPRTPAREEPPGTASATYG